MRPAIWGAGKTRMTMSIIDHIDWDEPPLGTLRDVARRHDTDICGARQIMGLPEPERVLVEELAEGGTFRYNLITWRVLRRFASGQVVAQDVATGHRASFARYLFVEPILE